MAVRSLSHSNVAIPQAPVKGNLKPLPPDWLENYTAQFARPGICICSVKGQCLEPRVMDGDWLAIDQNRSPRNGDVVMVKVGARRGW